MTSRHDKDAKHFAGMTLNERLFDAALFDEFDAAVRARDRLRIIAVLEKVFVQDPQMTADAIIEDPEKYGY